MDEAALIENLGRDFAQDLLDNRLTHFHNLILEFELLNGDCESEVFEELFRRFHGAKGTGGIFGMYPVSTIFHQLENYLTMFKANNDFDKEEVYRKMHSELDLVEKMAAAWLDGERDLYNLIADHKLSSHHDEMALILEPSKSIAEQIVSVLHENGYETTLVSDGIQAMQHLVTKPYHLLITSEQNRFINGSELISFIKITPRLSKIKTIYLTTETHHKWAGLSPDIVLKKDSTLIKRLDAAVL